MSPAQTSRHQLKSSSSSLQLDEVIASSPSHVNLILKLWPGQLCFSSVNADTGAVGHAVDKCRNGARFGANGKKNSAHSVSKSCVNSYQIKPIPDPPATPSLTIKPGRGGVKSSPLESSTKRLEIGEQCQQSVEWCNQQSNFSF